jgi:hypothetical protein
LKVTNLEGELKLLTELNGDYFDRIGLEVLFLQTLVCPTGIFLFIDFLVLCNFNFLDPVIVSGETCPFERGSLGVMSEAPMCVGPKCGCARGCKVCDREHCGCEITIDNCILKV